MCALLVQITLRGTFFCSHMYINVPILSRCHSSQHNLLSTCSANENPRKLFCGCQQTDSKVYLERQKTQKGQCNTEGK